MQWYVLCFMWNVKIPRKFWKNRAVKQSMILHELAMAVQNMEHQMSAADEYGINRTTTIFYDGITFITKVKMLIKIFTVNANKVWVEPPIFLTKYVAYNSMFYGNFFIHIFHPMKFLELLVDLSNTLYTCIICRVIVTASINFTVLLKENKKEYSLFVERS